MRVNWLYIKDSGRCTVVSRSMPLRLSRFAQQDSIRRPVSLLNVVLLSCFGMAGSASAETQGRVSTGSYSLTKLNIDLVDDLSRRSFRYFLGTGGSQDGVGA